MLNRIIAIIFAILAVYFLFWPVPVEPRSWVAPAAPTYEGDYQANQALQQFESMTMPGQSGPEGVVVDGNGVVYATTEQGWIVRWRPGVREAENWVKLPGRPLGICLGANNDFWVADAFEGVFHIDANGRLTQRLTEVNGKPLLYANDLVLAANGKLYLSDSTTRFSAKAYGSTYKASLVDILEHGDTGRVIEWDPASGASRVIMSGLSFANGVTADPSGDFILVNETSEYRVWKYWITGSNAGTSTVLIDNLPGFPDNIIVGQQGRFWLGFTSPRIALLDNLADKPFLRKMVQRLPSFVRPKAKFYGHILAINGEGEVVANLQDPEARYPLTTGASETDEYLYISSLIAPNLARVRKSDIGL